MNEPPLVTQTAPGDYNAQATGGSTAIVNVYQPAPVRPVEPAALAAAEQLLAGVPAAQSPGVAQLPPGSRMALRHNPIFVGREDALRTLGAALTSARIAAVTGLGGVGKTQLAIEFVHRYGQYFAGGVFWLSFADGGAVPSEIAACGGVGHLDLRPDFAGLPLADQVQAVLAAWASPIPRLLVFDNCEVPALLDQWQPRTGGCRVLLTSRRPSWPPTFAVQLVPLGALSREQSVTLLQKHLNDPAADPSQLAAIASELGDLPLALHLAGSVLVRYRDAITLDGYLVRLREPAILDARWLRSDEPSPTAHVQQLAATFALSYERLNPADRTDALALDLLARAAHLAPGEPISRDLLFATAELPGDDQEALIVAEDALARLIELGLLEPGTTRTLRLHRLLIVFVRTQAANAGAQAAVERAVLEMAGGLSGDGALSPLLALQPHLRRVTDAASDRGDGEAARLCMVLGDHLMKLADYAGATTYYARALVIRQERLGDRDPETVASMHSVGQAHKERGEFAEAQGLFEGALASGNRQGGDRDPLTVASLNYLGFVLKDQGRYTEALRYFKRALRLTKALRGEEDVETAVCLNNLGLVYKDRRAYPKAQHYFERALKISQAVQGGDNPGTVASLNNLAFVLKDQGMLAGAQTHFERALAINEGLRGEQYLETVASLNNLAFVLLDRALSTEPRTDASDVPRDELFAQARGYLERALAILEDMFPEGHPRRAEGQDSLGELLGRQGDYEGAWHYLERALSIRQQVFGEWHLETARSLSNLGLLLMTHGDLAQARSYLERAIAAFEHSLGPTHDSPDAARARARLAAVEARLNEQHDQMSALMASNLA